MAAALEHVQGKFSTEDVDRSLLAIAIAGGNTEKASAALKEQGITVTSRTLREWRTNRYPERYAHVHDLHSSAIEELIVRQARENAVAAGVAESIAIEKTRKKLEADEYKDPSIVARNLAVNGGINTDRILKLTDRYVEPSSERSAEELLKSLAAKLPPALARISDHGTPTIVDAQVITQGTTENPPDTSAQE